MRLVEGKVIIVTGANSGIGEKTAEILAENGAKLALAARREDKLTEVEERIHKAGGEAFSVRCDVTRREDCDRLVEETVTKYGRLDVLVNNAGAGDRNCAITRCSDDFYHELVAVNQHSVFYMMRAALRYMEEQGSGSIVNVSSIGGVFGIAGLPYSAAKAAVIAMTKNVAVQFAGKGIRCNAVCPGPTDTPLLSKENMQDFDLEFMKICGEHTCRSVPRTRPEDQANAILYFASDLSQAVTGQTLIIDNGFTL